MGCSLEYKKKRSDNSLLHLTCLESGHVHVVKFLVESGSDFNEKNDSGETPLMLASEQGFFSVVKFLSSVGSCDSSLVLMSKKSMSPLHYACKNGHKNVADFLISKIILDDVYLDKPDENEKTPLVYAYENGMLSVVEQLESRGCSLDVDEALLTSVCQSSSIAIVNRVIERNENIFRDVWKYFRNACETKRSDIAVFLMRRFDELLSKDGRDALLVACQNGCLCVIDHLVKRGFSLTQKTSNGDGLIHVSCKSNHSNVIHYLLDLEEQCDDMNDNGHTPLMIATIKGSLSVVQRLLELGCSLESKSKNGKSLLHLACNTYGNRHTSMAHLLLDAGATANEVDETGESVLRTACRRNLLSVVTRLADSGCSLEEKTKQEKTLLHAAGGKDVAEFLTSKVDVMLNALDSNGNTPCTAACQNGKVDVAFYLQEKGCSVNQRNKFGESPFSLFLEFCSNVRHPNLKNIKRFISAGAEISSTSTHSKVNVLHLAARTYDNEEFCHFFLNEGADPSSRDKFGKLPYEYASGDARKILREAWERRRYSKLKELGETKPSKIKVCLIGAAGAGKTTLMNSLRRKQLEEALSSVSEVQVDESSDPSLRTAGIDIIATTIDEAGDVVFCDFAGQPNFHKTHGLFFSESTTIYLLVVNLEEPDEELYSSSLYWLRLTKCSIGSSTNNSVVIIGSRGDKTDGRRILRRLRISLKSKFEELFDFSSEPFILDCRLSTSAGMQNLRKAISELKTKSIEKAPGIFSIVESIQSTLLPRLRNISKQPYPLIALEEVNLLPEFLEVRQSNDNVSYIFFHEVEVFSEFPSLKEQIKSVHCRQFVLKDFFYFLVDSNVYSGLAKDTLYQLVQFLHGIGEIIEFGDNIILDPSWLCHNVIGPLMSPETFPVCLEAIDDGAVSAERIQKVIRQFNKQHSHIPVDLLMQLLCSLEICYPVPNEENVYRFPALIVERRRDEFWIKDENMIVYVGRRLQCKDETDIIVPGTIPFLQTRSVIRLDPSPQIWKDGMVLEKRIDEMTTIEGLIELQETARAIDVVARGPVDSEAECWGFVKEMLDMVRKVLDDRSPGTIIDREMCLSTLALKKLVERPPAHKPSLIEIAMSNDSLVSTKAKMKKYSDTLRDLLIVPSDHYCMPDSKKG
ncbi:death-associated protein kinase 1-like isoform X2 [Oscarella lobularis]